MRRAIIAAENDGESTETQLWHGTPVARLITKEGFDPRVCSLDGMFGGGVYFADKSSKSVRYAGAAKKGDSGTLLLCRVSLGRPMLKWLPQPNMRRPPDPFPLFGLEHFRMWTQGRKFHSVFASCDAALSPLIMNEFIVYHTNQVGSQRRSPLRFQPCCFFAHLFSSFLPCFLLTSPSYLTLPGLSGVRREV